MTIQTTITMVRIDCCQCGFTFMLPQKFIERCRDNPHNDRGFYCSSCKAWQGWFSNSEFEMMKRRMEQMERRATKAEVAAEVQRSEAEFQRRRASAYLGHLGRTKKRVAAGVCPCCNRTFQDLARHMKSQHPDYSKEDGDA